MYEINIWDVLSLLRLGEPKYGSSSFNVACPCCDDGRDKHLNINVSKEVFRCPKCGVSGGMLALYSLYTNVPIHKAGAAIRDRMGITDSSYQPKRREPMMVHRETVKEYPMTDIDTRHATYSALLNCLSLSKDHKENLLRRGLTEDEILQLGYKTTPVMGMPSIARQLLSDGLYLAGVPGFYRNEKDEWTFVNDNRGILIPVRDEEGRIQGLQIRLDNVEKRKFRWMSSTDRKDGCRAEGWTHFSGTPSETLVLTEGPMKADVINALSGWSVLAVPGVNALKKLKASLETLRAKGLKRVQTAFDMDMLTNPNVKNGFEELLALLDGMDFTFGTYLWDPRYKGLDDYLWEGKLKKVRAEGGLVE